MKQIKTYKARTLFDGNVIGKEGKYIAIPNSLKKYRIMVLHDNKKMMVENWLNADGYRVFPDKYGRKDINGKTKQYTLGYFLWKPITEPSITEQWQNE